ncbi:MAG: UbiD family decarboxylase, partial [Dehalococcoidia bacterium]|nr:UbiD family decarboxylase [Dehalococcoidia bacterium]
MEALRSKLPKWEASLEKFKPKIVKTGPILENVLSGKDVDLLHFPVPLWHENDGGRYIGTGDAFITKDPDTGAVNLGAYRVMVCDRKTLTFHIQPTHHGMVHTAKYHARGQAAPMAISLGHHPLFLGISSRRVPEGTEYQYIGAIRGEPVEVIEEEVTGLPIPADSEIVVVGWCPPGKTRMEGPFGEGTGYYGSAEERAIM